MRKAIVAVVMVVATLGVTSPAFAAWDGCTNGRYCFYRGDGGTLGRYTTLNSAMSHDNLKFTDGVNVRDNANSVWNRTSCKIRVVDDRGAFPDDWHDISGGGKVNLISSVDNENDRHEKKC